jgi:hypothetical protein
MAAGPERRFSQRLGKKMKPTFAMSWEPIENQIGTGTPDVWYSIYGVGGWVELKVVKDYPARKTTPIRFNHFSTDQVAKLEEIGEGEVPSWVLCQIAGDYYLFHWSTVRELRKGQPRYWWEASAHAIWKNRINYEQLADLLTKIT